MATLDEVEKNLHYQALLPQYEAYGRQSPECTFYNYYVGNAMDEVAEEFRSLFNDKQEYDPRLLPPVPGAGNRSVERFDKRNAQYLSISNLKTMAPLNKPGSPARVIQPTGNQTRSITIANVFNEMRLDPDVLHNLRYPDQWSLQQSGEQEIQKQLQDFALKHMYMKQAFLAKAFADGVVYIDENGMILESSSGAKITIDLGVPSNHKTQLTFGSAIISADWATASTKILDHLDNLTIRAAKERVAPPKHVWLNLANKAWFRNNTQINGFYSSIEMLHNALNDPNGFELQGYVFHFVGGIYTSAAGSDVDIIPTTKAIITPDLGPWFLNAIGCQSIPNKTGITGGVSDGVNAFDKVYGDFAYTHVSHNPAGLSVFAGTNFMYAFREPKAVWMPTVTGF